MTQAAKRILLVDDSRVARLTLQHLIKLTDATAEITQAANGDEALAVFQPNAFDLALLDFNMPGIDGLELGQLIREQDKKIHLVLVTANIQDTIVTRAKNMGIGFLGKPVDSEQLANLLKS
ncbi:response regulator [Marinospirillum insulare]|uniref:Transcriptional regulator n=1 Tax=Marinospirillum insulare TaxID=217169 RepID=A0ABQ5ZX15_9GAMM|nr:response regulator [Marinospirillum insulare]GLR64716.1 transcriptional regulator [Marinospirillum insulare]